MFRSLPAAVLSTAVWLSAAIQPYPRAAVKPWPKSRRYPDGTAAFWFWKLTFVNGVYTAAETDGTATTTLSTQAAAKAKIARRAKEAVFILIPSPPANVEFILTHSQFRSAIEAAASDGRSEPRSPVGCPGCSRPFRAGDERPHPAPVHP